MTRVVKKLQWTVLCLWEWISPSTIENGEWWFSSLTNLLIHILYWSIQLAIEGLYLLAKAFEMFVYSMESIAMLVICEKWEKTCLYCIFMPPGIMIEWHINVARYIPSTASSSCRQRIITVWIVQAIPAQYVRIFSRSYRTNATLKCKNFVAFPNSRNFNRHVG